MHDPDTTLTDLALAALCAGFAVALVGGGGLALLYAGLFAALGVAALAGGLWHGWWPGRQDGAGGVLWLAVMVSIGLASLCLWLIAARLSGIAALGWAGWALIGPYLIAALFLSRSFLLPSAFSLPPTLALLVVFLSGLDRPGYALGAVALALALTGAVLQAMKIGLPALRLGHNALYHVIQAAAFTLLFFGVTANPVS